MNKGTLIVSMAAAFALCACNSSKVRISGRFVGGTDKIVYLEQVTPLAQTVVDSVSLGQDGSYRFNVKDAVRTPSLYNLIYNGERIPLLIAGGDRVDVSSVGSVVRNYTVEGSDESTLLRSFYQNYVEGARRLDGLAAAYVKPELTEEQRKELSKQYMAEYYRIRREQLKFIIENKEHLAAVYALYQRLPGDTNLFNGDTDVIYYRTVAEAIEKSYPESPYLAALNAEISRMDTRNALTSQIAVASYPDLELPDMYGKTIRLSSLAGKVILLDFWSATLANSTDRNAELKDIYKQYAGSNGGFEVYQVALDTSKPMWITAVQDQHLPWISVSDLRGKASPVVGLYNIQSVPANYLIDKQGDIVARDIYGKNLELKLAELTR